jgi:hypothetical protein
MLNGPQICDDIRDEAQRLATAVEAAGLPIRLMGGLAVWLIAPASRHPPFARAYGDLDFAAASKSGRTTVARFFGQQGYVPEKLFNALHGGQRLNFAAPDGRWTIDVVFDELNMSHRIDLRGRLSIQGPTLAAADLLLTKLQVWEINRKDLGDIACVLADHPLVEADRPGIDVRRIGAVTGANWGLCHTVERNLVKVRDLVEVERIPDVTYDPRQQAAALLAAIRQAPKSLGWRMRAKVGDRVRWYETPEEVRHS